MTKQQRQQAGSGQAEQQQAARSGHRQADEEERIAAAAYVKAEARGFAPGHALDDWLAAERELASAAR